MEDSLYFRNMKPAVTNERQTFRWYWQMHFLLVPLFFIIHNSIDFYGLVSFKAVMPSFAGWLLLPAATALVFYWFLRPLPKALLFTAVLMLAGFFSISLMQWFRSVPALSFMGRYSVFLAVLLVLLLLFFLKLRKSQYGFPRFGRFLTACLFVLIAYDLGYALMKGRTELLLRNRMQQVNPPELQASSGMLKNHPDIYFLVYDAFPGSQEAKEVLQVDLSSMDSVLQSMGFKVQAHVQAAAASTYISLFSTLNMCYPPLGNQTKINFRDLHSALAALQESNVPAYLRSKNYEIVNAGLFPLLDQPGPYKNEEWAIRSPEFMFYNQTLWNAVERDFGWVHKLLHATTLAELLNEKIRKEVDFFHRTEELVLHTKPPQTRPRFVYAHFNLPHGPYKFRHDGSVIQWKSDREYELADRKQLMREQVLFTQSVLPALCAAIQKTTNRQAVILVQGDHGLRGDDLKGFPQDYAFKTYSAVFFPEIVPAEIPDSLYLPNTFRFVFNQYFGQSLPLLKPRSFDLTYFGEEQIFWDDL